MGDIEVRPLCAKYCGCEGGGGETIDNNSQQQQQQSEYPSTDAPLSATSGCTNKLTQHPICRFGQICECEEFVNSPESEGCGGNYESSQGTIVVNDLCGQYCNACGSMEEIFEEAYMEVLTLQARKKCRFATSECKAMLSNLYSCGNGQLGIEKANPMIQAVVTKQGQKVALESAKLGHPSLHAGEEPQQPQVCVAEVVPSDTLGESYASAGNKKGSLLTTLMVIISTSGIAFLLW